MKKLVYFILLFLALSCERSKGINLDFPFDDNIVVYGFLGNDSNSSITVFNTNEVNIEIPTYLKPEIEAFLLEEGEVVDTFGLENEEYISNYEILPDNGYKVQINHNNSTYTSEPVYLVGKNSIADINYEYNSATREFETIITMQDSLIEPYQFLSTGVFKDTIMKIQYKNLVTEGNKVSMNFDFRHNIFNSNNEFLYFDTLQAIHLYLEISSIEKKIFDDSRAGTSGLLGNNNYFFQPTWGNIEGIYGYIATYTADSIYVEF